MARNLPAAVGFLVEVSEDGGAPLEPVFASLGSTAELSGRTPGQNMRAVLLHSGAPDGAHARSRGTTVILAGELYNQDELIRLLPADASPVGDAALVLALFAVYDVHAFRLLNGRFAALVGSAGRAVLATDHAGSVPLYACVTAGRVLAATEAKALRAAPGGRPIAARPGRRRARGHPRPARTARVNEVGPRNWVPR
ncbi:asparagine synthase, partial [Streptomyces sp. NPDC001928]